MKLLLDECLDWRLLRDLREFEVKSVRQMDWTGIENGGLLTLAQQQFDVFVTADKNLSFQQNVGGFGITVIVLRQKPAPFGSTQADTELDRGAEKREEGGEVQFIDE